MTQGSCLGTLGTEGSVFSSEENSTDQGSRAVQLRPPNPRGTLGGRWLPSRLEESMWNFPTLLARVCVLKEISCTGAGREAWGPVLPADSEGHPLRLWPQGLCSSRGRGLTASGSLFLAGVWRLGSLCPLRAGRASTGRAACQSPAATLAASAVPVDSDLSGSLAR